MTSSPMIQIRDLHFSYGKVPILGGVQLSVEAGQFVALVGPNGVGKSTVLQCIAGPETLGGHCPAGEIRINGRDAADLTRLQRARAIGYMPQHLPEDVELTVEELVWLGRHPHIGAFGRPGETDRSRVREAMEACDLQAMSHRPLRTLSGGERQRAYLASALSTRPSLLVLDEPTSALDLRHTLGLMRILTDLDAATLMATHDLNLAARYADSIAVLWDGKVVAQEAPAAALRPDLIRTVYGVEVDTLKDPATGRPVLIARERSS